MKPVKYYSLTQQQQPLDNLAACLDRIFRTFSPSNDFLLKKTDLIMNVTVVEPEESAVVAWEDHVDTDRRKND